MRILLSYFSATGNTGRIAGEIGDTLTRLGAEVVRRDITRPEMRPAGLSLAGYDAALFGAPIHSMRAPRLVREWLGTLGGNGLKCAMFFTYGGFQVPPAHHHTRSILADRGFTVVASAEFLGAHTYNLGGWESMAGRPDRSDCETAREYAGIVYRRFSGEDPGVVQDLDPGPYSMEWLDMAEGYRYKVCSTLPTRNGAECQMCLLCQTECPAGAMDADQGQADPDKCIACLRCVQICPDEALKVNDMRESFKSKMDADKETPETLKVKKAKMYL